jgi:hypothetical protein
MPDNLPPFDPSLLDTGALRALVCFEASACARRLEPALATLVKLRVSMLIGSPFCVDRYLRDAAARGERTERLTHILIGQESPLFSERERAALAWAEVVVRGRDTDAAFADARTVFAADELVSLTTAIAAAQGISLPCVFASPLRRAGRVREQLSAFCEFIHLKLSSATTVSEGPHATQNPALAARGRYCGLYRHLLPRCPG